MQASSRRITQGLGWVARAAGALVLLAATTSCHRKRPSGRTPHGEVVVLRSGARDEAATALARAIDLRLGGACPRRIVVTAEVTARALAETCVSRFTGPSRFAQAQPFSTGLVEWAATTAPGGDAEGVTLRSLARLAFARGLLVEAALKPASSSTPFQEIEAAAPIELDPDTRRGIALVVVEHLLSREGIDVRSVFSLASGTARLGVDQALERKPFHTDAVTLFARVRADGLSFRPPRAPALSTVELVDGERLLAQFDARLGPSPSGLLVCGERYRGVTTPEGDAITVTFDATRCPEVDGARWVAVEVGGLSTSPRGLDGAIVLRTFAHAESPPSLGGEQ